MKTEISRKSPKRRLRPHFEKLERRLLLAAEIEPNDTTAFASPFTNNASIEGTIGSLADIDYFKISLNQGARLRLYEVNFSRPYFLLGLPPSIEVLDEAGVVLDTSVVGDDLEITANQQGTYFVRVTSKSGFGDIADNYSFRTSVRQFSGVAEQEPNNVAESANALTVNQAFRGQLSSADASDFYSFNLNANDSLFVNFNGIPDQRPGVRLLDASGTVMETAHAGQGLAYNAVASGTFLIEVLDNSSAGQTQSYTGVIQVSGRAETLPDAGDDLDQSSPWALSRGNSIARGELSTLNDIDTFAITINSLARAEITFHVAGSENIPTYGRSMIAYDRQGAIVAKSMNGVLNIERYLGSTPGEYLVQVFADSITGLGNYGIRAWNFDDFSNQRDVPLHLVDFTQQFPDYWGVPFDAPFAATDAIPFVTGLLQSRFGAYDVDVTQIKPDLPLDRYIRSGFGDFRDLGGGLGGGYYGNRRPNGSSANNADETTWALQIGSAALIHEFGHAAGLGHARDISSVMSYYSTDQVVSPGARFGFVNVDQRRPDRWLTNDRNRLDWNLNPGSQVPERNSSLSAPHELDSHFREMTFELNESPQSLATQQTPSHLTSGDLNADGWTDIVVTHNGTTLSVYLSDTRGGFLAPRNYTVNTMAWWNESATVADFNGDGRDDVAVISREQETLTVLIANTDGTLVMQPNLSIGRWPQVVQSADMNADGFVDLVAANASNQVTILRGVGDGTFQPARSYNSGLDPNHLVLKDFNGDNRIDIATSNYGTDTISIMLGDSSDGYNTVGSFPTGSVARGLTAGDYDKDGDLDLASANFHARKLTIYNNRGDGLFDPGHAYDLGVYTENLTTVDMNQDGNLDLIASGNSWSIEVLLGAGDGTFSRGVSFPTPSGAVNSIALDVNKDGQLDIASISYWQNQLYIQAGKANSLRNDRVVVYGEITSPEESDVFSLSVTAGEEYAFDIDSAEFQYPLDAELTILSSPGSVLALNERAFDRESGIDSVDPYIVATFTTSETIRVVVSSQNGTAGGYRLKVTPSSALKKEGPRVLAVIPDNDTVIDSTRQISILMDKPIDPTTVHSDSILVRGVQSGLRSGNAFFDPLDGFLIWTADSPLPVDTYTVTLASGPAGVRDMFGNPLDGEIPADFKFPLTSGDGTSGGDFVTTFSVDRLDTTPPVLHYASYQRDPSNRGRFELRWSDELSFKSIENAQFTLRGAGPDGLFNSPDDRIQSLDAIYNKIPNLAFGQGAFDLYTRGYPDSDMYRIESVIEDNVGNLLTISEQINVGSTVPGSALFLDASRTQGGLTGSYVNRSLRTTSGLEDWRTTQAIAGTRVDKQIAFNTDSFGRRSQVNLTGGSDENWDEFSVQWDGWITIPVDGTRLQTRSDDGSRLWIDINKNGQFETSELFDNNWGRGQGITDGALSPGLAADTYQIRMQYEEGDGGNRMNLEWISPESATVENGHINGPSVIGMSIQPGSAFVSNNTKTIEVAFSGALDASSLTSNNFRLRFSENPDFFDGDDTFILDEDGLIQWDPTLRLATFEAASALNAGYYLVELNGQEDGIRNSAGKLLDGEFLSNFISGNTNLLSPSRHVSGNGIPGGDYRAGFSIRESLSLTIDASSITENGGVTTGTLTLNSQTTSPLTVTLASSPSSVVTLPASIVIPAGQTVATFTISAIDDSIARGGREVMITASAPASASATALLTVTDDEAGSLGLSIASATISENGGTATGTVTRNTPTSSALTVSLSSSEVLAGTVPNSVTIPAGQTSATFTITAVDDTVADGHQSTMITASASGLASATAVVMVNDDEVGMLGLTIAPTNVPESSGTAMGTVTRNTSTTSALMVSLSSSENLAATVPATVVIPAGQTSATFMLTVVNDAIVDGSQLTTIRATANGLTAATALVNVTDDDTRGITVSAINRNTIEAGGVATFTVALASQPTSNVTIPLSSSDPTEGTVAPANLLFTPSNWSVAQTVTITGVNDDVDDGDITFNIVTGAATGGDYNGLNAGDVAVTNVDDDARGITLSTISGNATEAGGTATFTVVLTSQPTDNVTIPLSSSDLSEGTIAPAAITFTPSNWNVAQTVTVKGINDNVVDGDVAFTIITDAATGGDYVGINASDLPLKNVDDDATPTVTLARNNAAIAEADGTSIITATISTASSLPVTINLGFTGTATLTSDYTRTGTQIVIPARQTTGTVTITALQDSLDEVNETVIVDVTSVTNGTEATPQQVTVTITDDDEPLDFGDAQAPYPVTLAQNGARHATGNLFLGSSVDAESNGTPSTNADSDGADEDGVFLLTTFIASTVATTSSFSVIASRAGKLDAWIDFNKDGDWSDTGEQIFASTNVVAGENLLSFNIPAGSSIGNTGARFRLSTAGGLAPTGAAVDGEVEDYLATIVTGSATTALDIELLGGDTSVVVEGDNVVVRKGTTIISKVPFASFGELNLNGSPIDDLLQLTILQALATRTLEFDGGVGKDFLELVAAGETLDLTSARITLRDVEGVDVTGTGGNRLVISIDVVKNASSTTDTLEVVADADDTITFVNGFKVETPAFINGEFTHILTETVEGGTARVELRNGRPLTNPLTPFDADRNGRIQPLDALRIINELSRRGAGPITLPTNDGEISRLYVDVSGDSQLTALDALRVLNAIARITSGSGSSGEGEAAPAFVPLGSSLPVTQGGTRTSPLLPDSYPAKKQAATFTAARTALNATAIDDFFIGYDDEQELDDEVSDLAVL